MLVVRFDISTNGVSASNISSSVVIRTSNSGSLYSSCEIVSGATVSLAHAASLYALPDGPFSRSCRHGSRRNFVNQIAHTEVDAPPIHRPEEDPLRDDLIKGLEGLTAQLAGGSKYKSTQLFKPRNSKPTSPDRVVTDLEFQELEKYLGNNWKAFGRKLGFSNEDIYVFEKNNQSNVTDAMNDMLHAWKAKLGKEATVGKLVHHLDNFEHINPESYTFLINDTMEEHKSTQLFKARNSKPTSPYRVVRDLELQQLVKHLGNNWKAFGRELGYSNEDIYVFERNNQSNVTDAMNDMLQAWKAKFGKEATVGKLVHHLDNFEHINPENYAFLINDTKKD
ncbi:uncharacterized protein LOC117115099 [Anneissia japonica]|uniref:uncharacterized protein LOC117115099 n=1 Tax=Anneissia japonica TaxID=1529436 RepID=UPI0014256E41|nr:uncharacterized protein LOC117115099 [Anneissia japonica]